MIPTLTQGNVSQYCRVVPTNLKLDDKLIEETVKLGGFSTKQEAITPHWRSTFTDIKDGASWTSAEKSILIQTGIIRKCVEAARESDC